MGGRGSSSGGGSARFPTNEAQIKHIFRDARGHLPDTLQNRVLITNVANNPNNYLGTDRYGNQWYAQNLPNGTQIWVRVQDGIINNAGINRPARNWDKETGLNNNPFKGTRKGK